MDALATPDTSIDGWTFHEACPPEWADHLSRCGGGFFHSPLGLLAGAPDSEPLFLEWRRDGRLMGIASGVQSPCRLSAKRPHWYFPTLPATVERGDATAALLALVECLKARNAAEVIVDSFAATWSPDALPRAIMTERREYTVPLTSTGEELVAGFTGHHRRNVARGNRVGWSLRTLRGAEAESLITSVHSTAVGRHARRGDRSRAQLPRALKYLTTDLSSAWGAVVFSAWDGDEPLSAALVGWGNGRAYYLIGGSTLMGYKTNASVWLHWKVMCALHAAGFSEYNLGGAGPVSPAMGGDDGNGLKKFKADYGAAPVPCTSARWVLRPVHMQMHRVGAWLNRLRF